ncbi:TetR/AcrR family transcriptional regulator [Actinoplanes solisilvae]|uniref:TetR/AcrR family transcriptional regulator n=1 Tax=Actinoplanes solisilvae TaxID=2486853 RepID=UPI001F0C6BA7|nr:TetR/AcrR family transcriptional regulator [Actinoplanes solisilvae]
MATDERQATRERIIRAARDLLGESGRDAVTTRSVSAAAGVQPPTIYRLFGDKDGLLDAVALYGLMPYLSQKSALGATADPVADLARAWDLHIEFGFTDPAGYVLAFGEPRPGRAAVARDEAIARLTVLIERVAAAGRLRTSVERATAIMHAAGVGTVLTQLVIPPGRRDPGVPPAMWATVRSEIIAVPAPEPKVADPDALARHASALRQALPAEGSGPLTPAERALLTEWLGRLADSAAG